MKIYITIHGQVSRDARYFLGDVNLPEEEVLLSEMGEAQAAELGKRLNAMGFHGPILASPLLRTMITAQKIAEQTGSRIRPTAWMHEIFWNGETLPKYRGMTLEEMVAAFPNTDKETVLTYPWWPEVAEDVSAVRKRVARGLRELLEMAEEDVLLVGHGASVMSALGEVGLLNWDEPYYVWNCSLSMHDTTAAERSFSNDVSHFRKDMVTNNKITGEDIGFQPYIETIKRSKDVKLMHIGDTRSDAYDHFRSIIETVKPDIIVHTGDTADEVKVGRIPGTKEEYLEKIQIMLDILKSANCKVYWVPGNNDLPEEIAKRAPFIQIVQPDTVIHMHGCDICFTHTREEITQKADIYLYGHGRRAAAYEEERDMSGEHVLNLNAVWNSYVCLLPQKKVYEFRRPECHA